MSDPESTKYDVFISYAHADADTQERKAVVEAIKTSIEGALKSVLSHKRESVFLDSEALKWGDEWSTKIRKCISNCRVFVYLLSPNYLKSDYCQREKLWWAKTEIDRGRLHKTTRAIYYIRLPKNTKDPKIKAYKDECRVVQANNRPFFQYLKEIKQTIVEDRIKEVLPKIQEQLKNEITTTQSYCTVYPRISKHFVGRVKELAHLNEMCCEGHTIPVISGYAGIGKTELAVAYTYAYAENFPQGRFLIPMEGITNWNDAMVKLVEQCRIYALDNNADLPSPELMLPEEWDKLPPDEKREAVYQILKSRSMKGQLLILLDNLEDLSLVSDNGLRLLVGDAGKPRQLCIIATTRLNEKSASSTSAREFYEIHELKEKDALELFYAMGDNRFSFAKWPFSNGELLLDNVPEQKKPSAEEVSKIKKEYSALKEIIKLLNNHAWSLELVAGFMAENYDHYSFQQELEDLRQSRIENLHGQTHRGGIIEQNAEKLLRRTLERLQDFNGIANGLGDHILFLATVAAFFPPDNIPLYALEGIWEQEYGNKKIVYDEGRKKAMSCDFALEQLKKYRIVNGDDILKMHRLTREVLLKRQPEDNKIEIIKLMGQYWEDFHASHPNINLKQVQPWAGWAIEWLDNLPLMQKDAHFLKRVIVLSNDCNVNNLDIEAETLNSLVLKMAKEIGDQELRALALMNRATQNAGHNFSREESRKAECDFSEALEILRDLMQSNQENSDYYIFCISKIFDGLGVLHYKQNNNEEAEREYEEALSIRRHLAASHPDYYDSYVANTLINFAVLLDSLNRKEEAGNKYEEALKIFRRLAKNNPERYDNDLARVLTNYAILHKNSNHSDKAKQEFEEALSIYRRFAAFSPERYDFYVAWTLLNLANLHVDIQRMTDAKKEYYEAYEIFFTLAESNHDRYDSYVAVTLRNIGVYLVHCNKLDEAKKAFTTALAMYRHLDEMNSEQFTPYITDIENMISKLDND